MRARKRRRVARKERARGGTRGAGLPPSVFLMPTTAWEAWETGELWRETCREEAQHSLSFNKPVATSNFTQDLPPPCKAKGKDTSEGRGGEESEAGGAGSSTRGAGPMRQGRQMAAAAMAGTHVWAWGGSGACNLASPLFVDVLPEVPASVRSGMECAHSIRIVEEVERAI